MDWFTYAAIPILVFTMWLYTAHMSRGFPTLQNKRIALLIAHPDDEAMFFAPTVLGLTRPELNNHVTILCLSSGDADGLGETRKKELEKSALHLGLRSAQHVTVIEDSKFPDSMSIEWDRKHISDLLTTRYIQSSTARKSQPPQTSIDVIITFDSLGVSNHPNHRSLYHGALEFQSTLARKYPGWELPIKIYTLKSTNVLRKYMSLLDAPVTLLSVIFSKKELGEAPTPLFFASGFSEYAKARGAMTTAHLSQMIWFRWGWIGLSRYMVMNDLKKEGK